MTFKEASESGKPFRRLGWTKLYHDTLWWYVEDLPTLFDSMSGSDVYECFFATDWVIKYNCDNCKDTKKVAYTERDRSGNVYPYSKLCPDCSAPQKYKTIKLYSPIEKRGENYMNGCNSNSDKSHFDFMKDKIVGWIEVEGKVIDND